MYLGIEHAYLQQGKVLAFGNPVSPTGGAMRQKWTCVLLEEPCQELSQLYLQT